MLREPVDTPDDVPELGGRTVERLVLGGEPGVELHLLTLGSTVDRLVVTGGDGVRRDVALGLPSVAARMASGFYLGGTIGRYANRIAGGRFPLEGHDGSVQVGTHDRGHHLHGGPDGFDRRVWEVVETPGGEDGETVSLRLVSPDGDQGFPGEVTALTHWRVTADAVRLDLEATTTATTVVNLTSHVYLNLDGVGSGTVDEHLLAVEADRFTPVDATGIPLGDHAPVDGTPFDLREARRVGDVVRTDHPQLRDARGVDHHLVLRPADGVRRAAVLTSPRTSTRVVLATDRPGLQVYTGNFLDGATPSGPPSSAGRGRLLRQGDGLALEPQVPPDSPNRSGPGWPSPVLRPGETYRSTITWTFGPSPRR